MAGSDFQEDWFPKDWGQAEQPVVPWIFIFLLAHHLSKAVFPLKDAGRPKAAKYPHPKFRSPKFLLAFNLPLKLPAFMDTYTQEHRSHIRMCWKKTLGWTVPSRKLKTHFSRQIMSRLPFHTQWSMWSRLHRTPLVPFHLEVQGLKLSCEMGIAQISFPLLPEETKALYVTPTRGVSTLLLKSYVDRIPSTSQGNLLYCCTVLHLVFSPFFVTL